MRNVFFDSGDAKMAGRLYDYFAQHVLSAEKEKGQIEMTMRSCDMPPELEIIQPGAPARNTTQVLTAATVFKSLLAGLPGGILGSQDLYRVLVEVYYARSSECDLERTESCLGGASVIDSTKTKAMAHAMLALTSQMQLELICAVFGVCSVLLHETDRLIQIEEDRRGRVRTNFLSGLMNLDRLGRVFGPLLMESREPYPDTFRQVESEIEGERVASMLISNWRFLSRQLRAWEQGGYRYHSRKSVSGSQSLGSIVEGKSGGY